MKKPINEESVNMKRLEDLTSDQLDILEKVLDQLKELDLSIDQLSAIMTGTDPMNVQLRQRAFGRLAKMDAPLETPLNEGWSDHKNVKKLTENFRKFQREE